MNKILLVLKAKTIAKKVASWNQLTYFVIGKEKEAEIELCGGQQFQSHWALMASLDQNKRK